MNRSVLDRLNAALEGHYRVEREIGRGGMAVVFLAEDLKHRRPVAIKVLDTDVAEAVGEERFAREIETAARLNHPNILALHDSGEADGLRYFVLPYIDGESLRTVLDREGLLDQDTTVEYGREIASALSYAHGQGLVHRDIKPENILLQAGHAVVCDFGIAKAMSEANLDTLTRTGTSVGTFAYMSPEQLAEGLPIDARSDVYSLGCVVHEMLDGQPPFQAATPQATMAKKLVGDLSPDPTTPRIPDTVWQVVRRSLQSDADRRYATADEFAKELGAATTGQAIARGRRRRRLGRVACAAAVAVAVGLVSTGVWLSGRIGGATYERLAVMPLANGSGDPREDFYVQGVFEDLVEEMHRAGLRVVNPSSTRRFADDASYGRFWTGRPRRSCRPARGSLREGRGGPSSAAGAGRRCRIRPSSSMRARTTRLKSLSFGIVDSSRDHVATPPPGGGRSRRSPWTRRCSIRESAPLCLSEAPTGGGPKRLGADPPPPPRFDRARPEREAARVRPPGQREDLVLSRLIPPPRLHR